MSKTILKRKIAPPFSKRLLLLLLSVVVLIAVVVLLPPKASIDDTPDIQQYFQVKKGPLNIVVSEAGVIKSRKKEIIRNEVEGSTTILWLIEEGRQVTEGELLFELDSSRIQDQITNQEIVVDNAEASWVNARENLDVVKNQAKSDLELAKLNYEFAKQDLEKYTKGDFPSELKELKSIIILKRESLQRSEEKLEWSRKLRKENFLSGSELTSDELATQKARIELNLAVENLALLKNYTFKRMVAELESNVNQSNMALARAERKAAADVVQAEAELRARESQFQQEKNKLEKLQRQLSKTRVLAPSDGLVVYATTAKGWRSNRSPLEAGQEVKERQELIYLTKNSAMLAEIRIPEVNLKKIEIGMPAKIKVDALPERNYHGTVASISPLPDAESNWFNSNLKYYTAEVHLDGNMSDLRTGMNCQVEIIVEQFEQTFFAPLQAVVKQEGQSVVYLADSNKPVQVKTGLDNSIMIRIISGVKEGDRLLLTPPFQYAETN